MLMHALVLSLAVAAEAPVVEVGSPAPDFTLADSQGVAHHLSDLRGRKEVVLVFFRGTW